MSSNKKCKADEILNTKTNRCVKRTGKIGKKIVEELKKKGKLKDCKEDEIRNPESNRCVKRNGAIGKRVIENQKNAINSTPKRQTKSRRTRTKKRRMSSNKHSKIKKTKVICEEGKILNPKSNRCVKINGPIGRLIRDKIKHLAEHIKPIIQEGKVLTKGDIKLILKERNVPFEGYDLKEIIINVMDEMLKENVIELLKDDNIVTLRDMKRELDKRNIVYDKNDLKELINDILDQ